MSGTLGVTEDSVFATVWDLLAALFGATIAQSIFKGAPNAAATPTGSYVVLSPGVRVHTSQGVREYDSVAQTITVHSNRTYYYQCDCYGPAAPDYAEQIATAWGSMWAAAQTVAASAPFQVLYAEDPVQLNFVNGENMYEQRYMTKLYLQVNQSVTLPQDSAIEAVTVIDPPVDFLPL